MQCKNVRTLFRSFDENADGTVSQHEFRKGIANLGAKRNGSKRFQNETLSSFGFYLMCCESSSLILLLSDPILLFSTLPRQTKD